ncbi:hypothetical protein AOLI_G00259280 [Acnodon oligacanthus]
MTYKPIITEVWRNTEAPPGESGFHLSYLKGTGVHGKLGEKGRLICESEREQAGICKDCRLATADGVKLQSILFTGVATINKPWT